MTRIWTAIMLFAVVAGSARGQAPTTAPAATAPTTTAPSGTATTSPADAASGVGVAVDRMSTPELMVRARAAIKEKKLRDAQGMFALASSREPDNTEIKLIGAEIAEANSDNENARRFYREILSADPAHFEANFRMGRAFNRANWWRQANGYLEKAARIAPTDRLGEVLTQWAQCQRGEKRFDEAAKTIENAVKQDPDSLEARGLQVTIRLDLKQFDQSIAAAKALEEIARAKVQNEPSNLESLRHLLDANLLLRESMRRAVEALNQVDSRGQATDRPLPGKEREIASLLIQLSEALVRENALRSVISKHELVMPLAERAVMYDPDNVRANVNLAVVYFDTANYQQAIDVCRRVLELDPGNAEAGRMLQSMNAPQTPTSAPAAAAADAPR
ncbi:MAG: tetratricopeptide repeat protein [Phycisphaerales bacterium]|nr:tetratricopeptide repeat protein [Phycisphaerales bacterium]